MYFYIFEFEIIALFTFEGIGIVLPLENKMRNKEGIRGWFGVLNTGMIFVSCLYIAGSYYNFHDT